MDWNLTGKSTIDEIIAWKSLDFTQPFGKDRNYRELNNPNYTSNVDDGNGPYCDDIFYYHVTSVDMLSGCESRSTYDSARVMDRVPPPPQMIDFVSFELVSIPGPNGDLFFLPGSVEMIWSRNPGNDIAELLIYHPNDITGQNDSIARLPWSDKEYTISRNQYNASDSSYWFTAQSIDACGRAATNFADFDYHKNINIEVDWNQCDSTMELSWNGYHYFHDPSQVEYEVQRMYVGVYGVDRVIARPKGNSYLASKSNWDMATAYFDPQPKYNYIHYATVKPSKDVEIQVYKDNTINVGGYVVYRGEDSLTLSPLDRLGPYPTDSLFTYLDRSALTNERAYYYKIVVENECGNAIDTSNLGTSIFLQVEARNEELVNLLTWNEYQGWDSAVAFYNIYRSTNGNPPTDLYATVPANPEGFINQYRDDVYDNVTAIGEFCYKVEAVQGPISMLYQPDLEPATSMSNPACVTQQPLFYVPNAFAPDGKNPIFRPSGQFFDYTLYEMIIYNRWGEQIFTSRDITEGWDGKVDGEPAPLGSYVYTIRFIDADGEEHRRKGTVTLIR